MVMHHHDSTAAATKKPAVKQTARKKSAAKKTAVKKRAPAKKAPVKDPHAGHDMKGMKMPADTSRKKTP
jgi:hypothetical protein